jgi:dTDP-4-amino-4,6-dideoxygalactose transaminase
MKVPFFRLKFTASERKEVLEVLNSGWVTSGPKAREFENKIRAIAGGKYAVAVSSCTAGLHLALKAFGIGDGDEVITSPFTMAATVESILYTGAKPVLADIDQVTLNINPDCIEDKITSRTRAILPVDIAGWPCDYDKIRIIARKHHLYLIEDAAHALGASYRQKPIGSLADATVFSFYSTKNITTGEGGMVVTDSKKLAEHIRHLSLHGMTSSGWKRYSGGGWKYDITELGYKENLSDLAAGLGLGQLRRFKAMQQRRHRLARLYYRGLEGLTDYLELPYRDGQSEHAWHLFITKMNPGMWRIDRDRLIAELERKGIGCGVHFIPVHHFSYFRKALKFKKADLKQTDRSFQRVISLPFYFDLSAVEIEYVCRTIKALTVQFGK